MLRYLSQSWSFSGMLATFALAGTATVSYQPALAQTGSQSCHLLTSAESIRQGFGAAYNLFSAAKEPLLNVECGSSSDAVFAVGNGQNTTYVYRFGYEWTGTQWKQVALGGQTLVANDWYVGSAQTNLFRSQAQLAEDNFVIAYTCQWINNAWKCGCRDTSCSQNYWQLQAFRGRHEGGGAGDHSSGLKSKYRSLYNEDLPYMGLFYGSVFSCFNHSLVRLGDDSSGSGSSNKAGKNVSVRFRAERTGNVMSFAYNNRYDPNGNGYSTGDGGRIHIELRADDGTAYHYPSNVVLGKTNSHTPGNWTGQFKTLSMKPPVAVEAGTLYHAVFVQEDSDYASKNGSRQYGRDPIFGPYYGDDTGATIGSLGGKWHPFGSHVWKAGTNRSYTQGYVAIGYEDGISVGTGGMCYHQNYAKIGGNNRIRENFIVEGPTRNVNGVWFRVGRKSGNTQPIILELKNASGKVLISRSVPASQISEGTFVHDWDILRTQGPIDWAYVDFGTVMALSSGARYTVELRSPSSTADGYTTHAFPDTEAWWKLGDRNQWVNAKAEISTNGGSSWGGLDQGNQDFGFGFTLDGGPKSIQSIANFKDGVNGGL